ncbi:MAG: hypothetical protein ACRDTM_06545, partial [Micromonosporaceae bacterium]
MTTDAAQDPDRFDGLFEHWERYAGECQGAESATVRGYNRGYDLAFYQPPDGDIVTVGSNGLRFQKYAALKEQELACSAYAAQEGAARYLVDITASRVIATGQGLSYGDVVRNDAPLVPDTGIYGVLAAAHPYFPGEFDLYRDADGEVQLHLITLVPVTEGELRLFDALGEE